MLRAQIREEIAKIVGDEIKFSVEASDNPEHGDYSSNAALVIAKQEGRNPKEVAEKLKNSLLSNRVAKLVERIEVAGPGFLNFFIARSSLLEKFSNKNFGLALSGSLAQNPPSKTRGAPTRIRAPKSARPLKFLSESFSSSPKRINIEFVSANPTGPLTMANGRGGFYGDVLANILEAVGHKITREYYINDAGNQIKLLGESILAAEGKIPDREELYKGGYIKNLKGKTAKQALAIFIKEIKQTLKNANIKFDVWFPESSLHEKGEIKKVLEFLQKKKATKKKEGALWLGDAVLVKSNGEPTYFLADLAYHYDKFLKRKFDIAINIWGADHHGYIERMKQGAHALGVKPERLQIIIMQLVRLMSKGKEIRMSKRAGEFVTLDDLLKEVGKDAARWFFLERTPNTHMDFDLDLAKERSKKNPVYYVQYAHARGCSILRKAKIQKLKVKNVSENLKLLNKPEELALIKKILRLTEVVEDIAGDYQVSRMTRYAYELARSFTSFYEKHKVVDDKNKELTHARLTLVYFTLTAMHSSLSLMGISAPEKM